MAHQGDFLMDCFRSFYQELIQVKDELAAGSIQVVSSEKKVGIREADIAPIIHERLSNLLRQQEHTVKDERTVAEIEAYETAQYIMAVLIDEIFLLELDWPGQKSWEQYLLEDRLFDSQNAGFLFFHKLEVLLDKKDGGELQEGLAALFLFALLLGFQGCYRFGGGAILKEYRHRLYRLLGNRKRDLETPLFGEAYDFLCNPPETVRLAPLGRWYKISIILFLNYLLIGALAWMWWISDLWNFFN